MKGYETGGGVWVKPAELYATAACAALNHRTDKINVSPEHFENLLIALFPVLSQDVYSAFLRRTSAARVQGETLGLLPDSYNNEKLSQENLRVLLELSGFPPEMQKALMMRHDYLLGQRIIAGHFGKLEFTGGEKEAFERAYGLGQANKESARKLGIAKKSVDTRLAGVRRKLLRAYAAAQSELVADNLEKS